MTGGVPAEVMAVWRHREQIEHEAAGVFAQLARDVAPTAPRLATRLEAAAADELRHAALCRAILDAAAPAVPPANLPRQLALGPVTLAPPARALYASVALGCITESFACALLLAMRQVVEYPPVVAAVTTILPDEIEHSRVGWAHLALAAAAGDVRWLGPHVAAMRSAALDHEVRAMPTAPGLARYGILAAAEVDAIADQTWRTVIAPGLARFGISI